MQKILDLISEEIKKAFEAAGYDQELGRVTLSNRPDLCEFQCNGAMAGAKKYHKAPLMIAQDVAEKLQESDVLSEVSAVAPGFLNMKVKESFVRDYLQDMSGAEKFGFQTPESKRSSLTTAVRMWQNRSMWDICAPALSGRASSGSAAMPGTT